MTPPRHAGNPGPSIPGAIDLHCHSTASDGLLSPEAVVAKAMARQVSVLALTDHDTMNGLAAAREALGDCGDLRLVPGVELSCSPVGYAHLEGTVHVVGLMVDDHDPDLRTELEAQSDDRRWRAARMIERLQALGHPITVDDVSRHAGAGNPGRPHIARALVDAGVVANVGEAFTSELIGDGGLAYVPRRALTHTAAVGVIRAAGGAAVLAHPGVIALSADQLDDLLAELVAAGLAGIEVDHPDHPPDVRVAMAALAARHNLVPIGSSDCHGTEPLFLGTETTSTEAWEALLSSL